MTPKPIALACSASHGDVAQTLTITNKTKSAIPSGTSISWVVGKAKGTPAPDFLEAHVGLALR